MKRFLISALIAACIAGVLFTSASCKKTAPGDVFRQYYSLLDEKKYAEAYALFSEPSKAKISEADFVKKLDAIYSEIGVKSFSADILVINESKLFAAADYTMTLLTNLGAMTFDYQMALAKESTGWKIEWVPDLIFPQMDWGDTVRVVRLTAKRGEIFAGETLIATNAPGVTVFADTEKVQDKLDFSSRISPLLGIGVDKIRVSLERNDGKRAMLKSYNAPWIDEGLKQELLAIEGVGIDTGNFYSYRSYPEADYYFHLVGYTGKVTEAELASFSDDDAPFYNSDSFIGKSGLEAAFEKQLRGKDGREIYVADALGNKKRSLHVTPAQNGYDLHLTIDNALQRRANDLLSIILNNKGTGAVVILDPTTGAVESICSYPSFNPNKFVSGISPEDWAAVTSETNGSPLFNKALQGLYPPGSVFKPVTASFALSTGAISANSQFPYKIVDDRWVPTYDNWFYPPIKRVENRSGICDLKNGMIWSDNIFFAWAAIQTGDKSFIELCAKAGIGESIPFDLPVARSRLMNKATEFNIKLLADSGYGQGELVMTPLQVASLFGAFATQGRVMQPYVVSGQYQVVGTGYSPVSKTSPTVYKEAAIDPSTIDTILPLLRAVAREGTAKSLRAPFPLAAKTGTAEIGSDKSREISWLVFFKESEPRDKLVLIMLDIPAGTGAIKFDIANGLLEAMKG